jgi:hypothetical protein
MLNRERERAKNELAREVRNLRLELEKSRIMIHELRVLLQAKNNNSAGTTLDLPSASSMIN